MPTITENDDADDADDDDKNGDNTRTRIHEKSRIERSRNYFAHERNKEIEIWARRKKRRKKKKESSVALIRAKYDTCNVSRDDRVH